jgi:hypothetical protein
MVGSIRVVDDASSGALRKISDSESVDVFMAEILLGLIFRGVPWNCLENT